VAVRTDLAFAEVRVDRERPSGRVLLLDGRDASHVDLEDPTRLAWEYVRRLGDLLDLAAPPRTGVDVVHVGGGACTLARYVAATRPGSRQLVLEPDAALVALAREALGLRTSARLRVKAQDGRSGLQARAPASADAIVLDAFVGPEVPPELTTPGFAAAARRALRPGGLLAANVVDEPPLARARALLATLADAFAHVLVVAPNRLLRGRAAGNVVLAASDSPLPVCALAERAAPERVLDDAQARAFRGGARAPRDTPRPKLAGQMQVKLPDGTPLELPDGATGSDAAHAIGPRLAKAALAVRDDGHLRDLSAPLHEGQEVRILTQRDGEKALELIRHDAAHVLATAVTELFPGVKVSIGPPIAGGFYYDFEFPAGTSLSEDDLPRIEERMREHIAADEPFEREDVSVADALERFRAEGQDYKVELIEDLVRDQGVETVSLYRNGPFTDLCRGPHSPSTKRVGAVKLLSVAGAYWRGDARRQQLTRVYGTAFFTQAELDEHLRRLEEARARDHRRLGRELGLFVFSELSPGMPLWQPNGMAVWNALSELWREENGRRGYREVRTPILYDVDLFKQSGHWDKYRDHMYFTEVEERPMGMKPMNCPAHIQLYKDERRSYRDLPIRFSEQGHVHRHEPSGTLHGLLRVRGFFQDDAHIFCTEEQLEDEIVGCLEFGFFLYRLFGFEPRLELSTRPENRIGDDAMWDAAEAVLERALHREGLAYEVNEGDGAFYGPKIDLHMTDSIGRSWQLGTVQLDYAMPERFGLAYTGSDDLEHRPVMVHRALLGSFERFIGILTEHYGGEFPAWLAPVQAVVLPIADRHADAARAAAGRLADAGLRAEVDERGESVRRKIREAELRKVPFMLVVGDREAQEGTVSVREHTKGDTGTVAVDEFVARLAEQVASRAR
jgi:threonyl-tRNA synthetase